MNKREVGKGLEKVRQYFRENAKKFEAQEKEKELLERKRFWRELPGQVIFLYAAIWVVCAWGVFWRETYDNNAFSQLFAFLGFFVVLFGVYRWLKRIDSLKEENQRLKSLLEGSFKN